jgi:hypothetical protein
MIRTETTRSDAKLFAAAIARRDDEGRRERMSIFKCPYCPAEYELTTAHLSFQQRSYAKCQVCHRTMYSWSSRNVPRFSLMNPCDGKRSLIQTSATSKPRQQGLYDFIEWQRQR